jgi:hypothetical protein
MSQDVFPESAVSGSRVTGETSGIDSPLEARRMRSDDPHRARTSGSVPLEWGTLTAVYVLLRTNIVGIPLERDEGLFGYIGQIILDGGLPYRDVIDHKPPVVHYLYALAGWLLPSTATAIHFFAHVYTFGTLLACCCLAKALTGSRSAGLWTALSFAVVSSLPSLHGFAASTEMFLLLPATLGLWCAVVAARNRRFRLLALSGAMGSLAFLTKQTGGLFALFTAIYVVVSACRGSWSSRRKLYAMVTWGGVWMLGFLGPIAFIAAYFGLRGGLSDLIYWVVTYNLEYTMQGAAATSAKLAIFLKTTAVDALPLSVAAVGTAIFLLARRFPLGLFLVGFLGFSLLAIVPGAAYPHYLAQLAPAIALAAGIGISRLCAWFPWRAWRRDVQIGIGALVVFFPVATCSKYYLTGTANELSHDFYGGNPFPEAKGIADFVAARTTKEEHVFVLGSEAEILFHARRHSPTRFALKYPLTVRWSKHRHEYQRSVIATLAAAPPRYIIIVHCLASQLLDGTESYPLGDYIAELTRSRYLLEAIQPVTAPTSELIFGDALAKVPEDIAKGSLFIYRRL